MNEKTLIVGTSPDAYIIKVLESLKTVDTTNIAILTKKGWTNPYFNPYNKIEFTGKLNLHKIFTMIEIALFRPKRIVIVCGKNFFHNNVLHFLATIYSISKVPTIECFTNDNFVSYNKEISIYRKRNYLFLFFLFILPTLLFNQLYNFFVLVFIFFLEYILAPYINPKAFDDCWNYETDFTSDIELTKGWQNKKGGYFFNYHTPGQKDHYINITINADRSRVTSANGNALFGSPLISLYGCSYFFGSAVNDDQTVGWKLQELQSSYQIKNYGAPGYSNFQQFLIMEETFKCEHPQFVILGFGDWQEDRNVNEISWVRSLANSHRRLRKPFGGSPSCTLKKENQLVHNGLQKYRLFPYSRYSHIILGLEMLYNHIMIHPNRKKKEKITKILLFEIRELCRKHNTTLIIFNVNWSRSKYEQFFRVNGFYYIDYKRPLIDIKTNMLPFDPHPSESMHTLYAGTILKHIEKLSARPRSHAPSMPKLLLNPIDNKPHQQDIYTIF